MAPNNKPAKTYGYTSEIKLLTYNPALCKNPPYNANETKAADPIANPFPIAAVVLPAASKPSVTYLTYGPIYAI